MAATRHRLYGLLADTGCHPLWAAGSNGLPSSMGCHPLWAAILFELLAHIDRQAEMSEVINSGG